MLKKFVKNKKGFTLIELVIVVAILGVLALLIVPNVVTRVEDARNAVLDANIKVINNAIKLYYAMEGDYPTASSLEELIDALANNQKYLDSQEADNAKKNLEGKVKLVPEKEDSDKILRIEKQ